MKHVWFLVTLAMLIVAIGTAASAAGLPVYPGAKPDGSPRSMTMCDHHVDERPFIVTASLSQVLAWYRKAMPGVRVIDASVRSGPTVQSNYMFVSSDGTHVANLTHTAWGQAIMQQAMPEDAKTVKISLDTYQPPLPLRGPDPSCK